MTVQYGLIRRIGGCGHFRLRDKDGGHTIGFAISENTLPYANLTALSFREPELLPIEVLHCGNSVSRVFAKNSGKYHNFCSYPKKTAVAETRLLSHKTRTSVKPCDFYRWASNKKVTGGGKYSHGWWQFHAYAEPPPLKVKIPKLACGVRSST